jgi:glycosyltransferase involved in cell wall biosynthesis/Tfp pilus assembly protein PilF
MLCILAAWTPKPLRHVLKRYLVPGFILGFMYPSRGDQNNARQFLSAFVLMICPPQRLARFEFGRNLLMASLESLFARGELRGARAVLNHLLASNSDSPRICALLAMYAFKLGEFHQAFDVARRALALERNCHLAETIVFRVYKKFSQLDEARARLAKLEQEGQFSLVQLSRLAEVGGHTDQARQLLLRQLELKPKNPNYFARYLDFLLRCGEIKVAHQSLARAGSKFRRNRRLKPMRAKIAQLVDLCGLHDAQTRPDSIKLQPALFEAIFRERPKQNQAIRRRTDGSKIAVVIDTLGPGGAERQCAITCQALSKHRAALGIAEVQLFCRSVFRDDREAFYLPQLKAAGVQVTQFFNPAISVTPDNFAGGVKLGHLISMLPARSQVTMQLINRLVEYDPDIIFGWQNDIVSQIGLAKAVIPQARIVGRWGSMPPSSRAISSHAVALAEVYRETYRVIRRQFPDAKFVANSKMIASTFSRWLGWEEHAVDVIYNGFDFSTMTPARGARARIRRDLGIPLEAYVFGGVFRMSEEKRPFLWLDIAEEISRKCNREVHFVIVGDGPLLETIRRHLVEHPQPNVHIVGRKNNIADWYESMDAFLLTSRVEGMSNAVIEAQWFGLPVICFKVGGLDETLISDETGFLVEDNDVRTFVERSIETAVDRARSREMGIAGKQFIARAFGTDSLVKSLERTFA